MPADEDYGRRQITLQQHASQSPSISIQCPAGCVAAPVAEQHRQQQDAGTAALRYASDKNLLESASGERERYGSAGSGGGGGGSGGSDRFGSERSNSDRLPSGERYQGVSERFPLGERPQTSVSTDRLLPKEMLQTSGHCQNDRPAYQPER